MAAVTFQTLWNNYPSEPPYVDAKTGKPPAGYENQCAIKVSVALAKSGVSLKTFKGNLCPAQPNGTVLATSAQELANWLNTQPFNGCPKAEVYTGKEAFEKIKGRSGILFLADYWQRTGETGKTRTGDHIDLWNGSRMTSFSSWVRVHFGVSWDGLWSDYRGASKVMFWPIK